MGWFLAELEKGPRYPVGVPWPAEVPAFVPLTGDLLRSRQSPPLEAVALFWRLPGHGPLHPLIWLHQDSTIQSSLDMPQWLKAMQEESYREEHRTPLTARLNFNYHRLPGPLRFFIIKHLLKFRSWAGQEKSSFPVSFFNGGCEILLAVCQGQAGLILPAPLLVLTHDMETSRDFDFVEPISRIETERGFRSCWNVIPCRYDINRNILHGLMEDGHEIGLHGIWHNSKEPFLGEQAMAEQYQRLTPLLREFSIQGYRSPAWFRTKRMFRVLAEFFRYDSSCLDNDLVCPAGYGGVGLMRPFRLAVGLVELPCTLPFEAPIYLGIEPEDLLAYWRPKIDFVRANRGMLLINTHSDPQYGGNARHLRAYAQLLTELAQQGWQAKLPRDVAAGIPT